MRLINVKAFIKRESMINMGWRVARPTRVLEFHGDEATDYAILSHRWIDQEVNYEEMVNLTKMDKEERDEVRQRDGYRKILNSCAQAKRDRYEWLWVDTCCIDKRSSAELSEAINSMYRWYENSRVCYAYLHDVPDSSFPTGWDNPMYSDSRGWPEWFSRGWTLQEMIAPSNVQFFNKDWQPIGDKRTLAHTLSCITGVPEHILTNGFSSNRPCVAQIMSWAAKRTTTRVEDRAYSLLGLLGVNMPMLYGEGEKAFHRLQLEIICISNNQSIFAWGTGLSEVKLRTGSILADDPSFFEDCHTMELMDYNEFIQDVKYRVPDTGLCSAEDDRFGTFPITNRGIQIWMLLSPWKGSDSVFEAWLPCRYGPLGPTVSINLALWRSNYYRYFSPGTSTTQQTLLRQVYLRYQDTPHCASFEIDDSAIIENGFTYCNVYPSKFTGDTFTLTSIDPLCVKVYSDKQADRLLAVCFGQCFGQDWIHTVCEKPISEYPWEDYAKELHRKMLARGPEHARSMAEVRSRGGRYGRICVKHTRLPGSTWTVRTSCSVWATSRNCGVKLEISRYPYNGPDKWMGFDAEGTNNPDCDIRGLMIPHSPTNMFDTSYTLLVDGVSMEFSRAPDGIKLGDYGYFTDTEDFCCEGNIFADLRSLALGSDITPRHHKIDEKYRYNADGDYIEAHDPEFLDDSVTLYKPLGLSVPSNHDFNSLLASLSTRLTNRYLVIRVIHCATVPSSEPSRQWPLLARLYRSPIFNPTTPLCTIAKPFVWHRDEGTGSASEP
ncbi:heterokaryon incompatibility protein-domain-containing protein [Scleroderma yunnanense]